MRGVVRWAAGIILAIAAAGCGSGTGPSAPTPQPRNLAGQWAGAVGVSSEDGRSLGLVWNAERQGGGELSGRAMLSTLPSAPVQITFAGTMTSSRSGDRFLLTYASDAGSPSAPACAASATGDAQLQDFTLVGNLAVTFHACESLGLEPPASTHLELLMKLN